MIQRWLGFTLQTIVAVMAVIVVTLATQIRSNAAFTSAGLISLMSFGDALSFIIQSYTAVETSIGAIIRLKGFSNNVKPEGLEGEDIVPPRHWPPQGGIQISRVSASYD